MFTAMNSAPAPRRAPQHAAKRVKIEESEVKIEEDSRIYPGDTTLVGEEPIASGSAIKNKPKRKLPRSWGRQERS